jgi:hypothetical protein
MTLLPCGSGFVWESLNTKGSNMRKLAVVLPTLLLALACAIFALNSLQLQSPMNQVLTGDPRNTGIGVSVHFSDYINTNVLVYDLKSVSPTNSEADVFRVLLQFADRMQSKQFKDVQLCFRGKFKFDIGGEYFRKLGVDYSSQNPVYTMRTFAENLMNADGTHAYPEWTGGLIGVLQKQMADFADFHKKWYVEDMAR